MGLFSSLSVRTFFTPLLRNFSNAFTFFSINSKSDFIQILRNFKIPEMRFSKYCMGMMKVHKEIKHNRFKPKLLQINKILAQA